MVKLFETKIDKDSAPVTKESKMVGAYVPQPLADYMAMFCLHMEIGRSDIFRQLITNWYEKTKSTYSENQLILDIAKQIQRAWTLEKEMLKAKPSDIDDRFHQVKSEVIQILSQRGVSPIHIQKIIKKVER